jgi:3-oxoacyl-[acyl-carrier-protein] synthase II
MRMRRVAITGLGAVSPYGRGADCLFRSLKEGKSGISRVPQLQEVAGLGPRVAGIVPNVGIRAIPRKIRRSMSPMSAYAYLAAQEALAQARMEEDTLPKGRAGIAIGSTLGSPESLESFFRQYFASSGMDQVKSMLFFRIMSHTAATNVAQALGLTGRVIAPSAACSSGCQAIGIAYEAIAFGRQEYMLCGGTDEFHPLVTGTFDRMTAASSGYNDRPDQTPRPFDKNRDGVVCAEGAGVLFLESLDAAEKRGATILAEILGFASLSDPGSIAEPSPEPITACMRAALDDAGVSASDIAYVNAHATGTELGDIAESRAIAALFGDATPVSSLKGHLGHTMAASGALETVATVSMLRNALFLPTNNLEEPDDRCSGIRLLQEPIAASGGLVVKNSFALGGINCSLVLRGYDD